MIYSPWLFSRRAEEQWPCAYLRAWRSSEEDALHQCCAIARRMQAALAGLRAEYADAGPPLAAVWGGPPVSAGDRAAFAATGGMPVFAPLPGRLAVREHGAPVRMDPAGLRVSYCAHAAGARARATPSAAVVASDVPVPGECALFYFEAALPESHLLANDAFSIGLVALPDPQPQQFSGLSPDDCGSSNAVHPTQTLCRCTGHVGWQRTSVGFVPGTGEVVRCGRPEAMAARVGGWRRGPAAAGCAETVGCLADRLAGVVRFTRNGRIVGGAVAHPAWRDGADCGAFVFPALGLWGGGAGACVSFAGPFVFDVASHVQGVRAAVLRSQLRLSAPVPERDVLRLVHAHLVAAGCVRSARALRRALPPGVLDDCDMLSAIETSDRATKVVPRGAASPDTPIAFVRQAMGTLRGGFCVFAVMQLRLPETLRAWPPLDADLRRIALDEVVGHAAWPDAAEMLAAYCDDAGRSREVLEWMCAAGRAVLRQRALRTRLEAVSGHEGIVSAGSVVTETVEPYGVDASVQTAGASGYSVGYGGELLSDPDGSGQDYISSDSYPRLSPTSHSDGSASDEESRGHAARPSTPVDHPTRETRGASFEIGQPFGATGVSPASRLCAARPLHGPDNGESPPGGRCASPGAARPAPSLPPLAATMASAELAAHRARRARVAALIRGVPDDARAAPTPLERVLQHAVVVLSAMRRADLGVASLYGRPLEHCLFADPDEL